MNGPLKFHLKVMPLIDRFPSFYFASQLTPHNIKKFTGQNFRVKKIHRYINPCNITSRVQTSYTYVKLHKVPSRVQSTHTAFTDAKEKPFEKHRQYLIFFFKKLLDSLLGKILNSHAGCMNNLLFIQPARWSFRDCKQSRKDRKIFFKNKF